MRRKAPIAWEKICDPKVGGRLNIIAFKEWNRTTIGKLLWNIHVKVDKLWIRWLDTYYLKDPDILSWQVTQRSSWVLKKIIHVREI